MCEGGLSRSQRGREKDDDGIVCHRPVERKEE